MTRALTVLLLLAIATPAAAAVAPGRVLYPIHGAARERTVDAAIRVAGGVLLPDGGVLMLANPVGGAATLLRLRADGSVVARHGLRVPDFMATQVMPLPDGRALVTGTRPARRSELPRLAVVRINPDLTFDPTYGIAEPGIQGGCGNCLPSALQPDGSLYVTGQTGEVFEPANPADLRTPPNLRWVISRIGPNGETGRPLQVSDRPSTGYGVGVADDGRLVALGSIDGKGALVALRPDGAQLWPPVAVSGLNLLVRGDGTAEVVDYEKLTRIGPDGQVRHTVPFVPSGIGTVRAMPSNVSGGTLIYTGLYDPTPKDRLSIWHLTPDGRLSGPVKPDVRFGGRLGQNSFRVTDLLQRPDGSLLAVGAVALVRYTGEGSGYSRGFFAAADLQRTDTFGGAATTPKVSVRVMGLRKVRRFTYVRVRVTSNVAGALLLNVRDERRRLLASTYDNLYAPGTTTIDVPATKLGRARLPRTTRVRAGHDFSDVFGVRTSDVVRGRLR